MFFDFTLAVRCLFNDLFHLPDLRTFSLPDYLPSSTVNVHFSFYQFKVLLRYLKKAKAELVTPGAFIFDKIKLADHGRDGCFLAVVVFNIPAVRNKILRHFMLINLVAGNLAYSGKGLERFIASVALLRGVADHPISGAHSFQWPLFAMVSLYKTPGYAPHNMVFRNYHDPVFHTYCSQKVNKNMIAKSTLTKIGALTCPLGSLNFTLV